MSGVGLSAVDDDADEVVLVPPQQRFQARERGATAAAILLCLNFKQEGNLHLFCSIIKLKQYWA